MYSKAGSVLRLEMVINEPEGFTVRKEVTRKGKKVFKWVDMLKGVAYLFRYKDVSLAANGRYLNPLAQVDDPTDAIRTLDRITTRKQIAPKRTAKAFNPVARDEVQIFRALLAGQHMIRGFSNPDIRQILKDSSHMNGIADPKRRSAKTTRILNRCHAHQLIAKIPQLPPLARYQTRTHRHVRSSTTTRRSVYRFPFDGCRLIPRFPCETQRRQG